MNYVISEEELNELIYITVGSNHPKIDLKIWLKKFKSKQPVGLVAEGKIYVEDEDSCYPKVYVGDSTLKDTIAEELEKRNGKYIKIFIQKIKE